MHMIKRRGSYTRIWLFFVLWSATQRVLSPLSHGPVRGDGQPVVPLHGLLPVLRAAPAVRPLQPHAGRDPSNAAGASESHPDAAWCIPPAVLRIKWFSAQSTLSGVRTAPTAREQARPAAAACRAWSTTSRTSPSCGARGSGAAIPPGGAATDPRPRIVPQWFCSSTV